MPTVGERITALVEWAPALSLLSGISGAKTPHEKAERVLAALQFVAKKTNTPVDDDLLERVQGVLASPEGAALFEYCALLLTAVAKTEAI